MSSSSESAEAVLATVIAARRRIDHLTTRHLPAQRALALEIRRTVGASREREQVMMLSRLLDRRLEMIRGSLSQPLRPTLPISEESPVVPMAPLSPEPSPQRGLRTIPLNGGDPDDVTLTDSDRVRLILDAEDLDADEPGVDEPGADAPGASLAGITEQPLAPLFDEDDIPLGDGGQEEDTVEYAPEAVAQPEVAVEETVIEDDIAWIVDGRRPPGFEDDVHSPAPVQSADPNAFLNALEDIQVEEHSALSPEEELDRLVLEELERARAELIRSSESELVSEEPTGDEDEDADIRHLFTDESDSDDLVSDSGLVSDSDLVSDDHAPDEESAFPAAVEDFSHLVIDDDEQHEEPPSAAPPLVYTEASAPLVLEDEDPESTEDHAHDNLVIDEPAAINLDSLVLDSLVLDSSTTSSNATDDLVIDDDISLDDDDISLDDDDVSLVSAHPDSRAARGAPRSIDEGLEESTVLMDSNELSRILAAETAAPRAVSARMPVLEDDFDNDFDGDDEFDGDDALEQPRGAAIQLLGSGQARTLGHTLELEAADEEEDDFADEWDSDEDSDEVSRTGELSISFEEEYEDEPIIPQLTESPSVSPATPEAAQYAAQIDVDDISRGLAQAREVEAHGDLQNAIILYGDVIDLDPTSAEARMGRGRCMMELGDYAAAVSDFQRAEDLQPTSAEPALGMGDLFYARKDYSRAIEFYTQAINLDASQVLARVRRGMCFFYKKNNQKALVDLERAYAMDPSIPGLSASISQVSKAMHRR